MCDVLGVSRSGYYAWLRSEPDERDVRRQELGLRVRKVFDDSRGRYGSPRVHQALKKQGLPCNRKTVEKIMKAQNLSARRGKRFVPRTTDSAHGGPIAPNLVDRCFTRQTPNEVWVSDITYIPTKQGWLYLAGVLDLCTRRIVGWAMMDHMEASLVMAALEMALGHQAPPAGLIVHSDRGSQYASDAYQGLLAEHKLVCSMSGKGDCYDNAVMESCWATIKRELTDRQEYQTREQAKQAIYEYIEVFYNRVRLHSALGYMSPQEFEDCRVA